MDTTGRLQDFAQALSWPVITASSANITWPKIFRSMPTSSSSKPAKKAGGGIWKPCVVAHCRISFSASSEITNGFIASPPNTSIRGTALLGLMASECRFFENLNFRQCVQPGSYRPAFESTPRHSHNGNKLCVENIVLISFPRGVPGILVSQSVLFPKRAGLLPMLSPQIGPVRPRVPGEAPQSLA